MTTPPEPDLQSKLAMAVDSHAALRAAALDFIEIYDATGSRMVLDRQVQALRAAVVAGDAATTDLAAFIEANRESTA